MFLNKALPFPTLVCLMSVAAFAQAAEQTPATKLVQTGWFESRWH
jgi:hypothetical protein